MGDRRPTAPEPPVPGGGHLRAPGDAMRAFSRLFGGAYDDASSLPVQERPPGVDVVVTADADEGDFTAHEAEMATAFAEGATIGLALLRLSEQRAAQSARQAALARAAKTLNESLDPDRVLVRICE